MQWLEVSLTVNGELAEAVAEVFARYSRNGVTTEQGIRHLDDEDAGTPDGPVTVRAYVPADGRSEETRRKIEEGLHYLGMIQELPSPTFRLIADQNWMETWRQHYRPIPLGRRLVVLPVWIEPTDPSRIAIKIDPGMAFGTGTHPSTQLCLELIDSLLGGPADAGTPAASKGAVTFIDIGCGSGILSIAAMKLGASTALGVDIDPAAIQNARENARVNQIGPRLALEVGSVGEIQTGRFILGSASLVVVNILGPVIVRLFEEGLGELLEPGGSMILSGMLETQTADVEYAARKSGLTIEERRQMGEWVALEARRQD